MPIEGPPPPPVAMAAEFPVINVPPAATCALLGEDIDKRRRTHNDFNVRNYTRVFKVLSQQVDDSPVNIANCVGLPRMLDSYNDGTAVDVTAYVNGITPQQQDGSWNWLVEVTYSSQVNTWRTRIDWAQETYHEGLEYDQLGDAIVNTAGDPMTPAQQRERGRTVITMTRREPNPNRQVAYNPNLVEQLRWCTNSLGWYGYPPYSVLLTDVRARDLGEVQITHEVQYVFKVGLPHPAGLNYTRSPNPWDLVLLNKGTRYLNQAGNRIRIVDAGRPGHQALLDINGQIVSRQATIQAAAAAAANAGLGAAAIFAAQSQPLWLVFTRYPSADFTQLGLP